MDTNTTAAAPPALPSFTDLSPAQPTQASPSGSQTSSLQAESSMVGRFVAILTPLFAILAGGMAGWVAKKFPGVQLDSGQIVAFMVTAATAALTAGFKFLTGWQQHEQNVADGKSPAIKPAATRPPQP
jgi:hypothetical protein